MKAQMPLTQWTKVLARVDNKLFTAVVLKHMITAGGTLYYHVRATFADDACLDGDWIPARDIKIQQ